MHRYVRSGPPPGPGPRSARPEGDRGLSVEGGLVPSSRLVAPPRKPERYIPDPSLKRQTPRATGSPNLATWLPGQPFAQPFECPSLLVVSHRAPRSRQNRLVVESPLIEDVFVCCTRFLRMYFHRVSSRHWPSPLTHQDAARITQGLLLTSRGRGSSCARAPPPRCDEQQQENNAPKGLSTEPPGRFAYAQEG